MDSGDYDEFGNYIGPELPSDDEEDHSISSIQVQAPSQEQDESWMEDLRARDEDSVNNENDSTQVMEVDVIPHAGQQVVLHDDKKYYPYAEEVFGPDVEAIVQEEDTQALDEPIIAPIKTKSFALSEKDLPSTTYSKEFLFDMTSRTEDIRNIALVGSLHHGKTSLVDLLVQLTHDVSITLNGKAEHTSHRYTDIHNLERSRGLSLKSQPISLLLPNSKGKHYLFNIMDTPGHIDFLDEAAAALRLCDAAILIIDSVEGVVLQTEELIKQMIADDIPFVVLINKIDRLCLELKLPPNDAYFKLKHTIEDVNVVISSCCALNWEEKRVSPELGNVCFASSEYGFMFSLRSFASLYADAWDAPIDLDSFSLRLWGDVFYDADRNKFVKKSLDSSAERSFVSFIMNPLYKLFSHTISHDGEELKGVMSKIGLYIKKSALKMDIRPLVRNVCQTFFEGSSALVDMCVKFLPSPIENAERKVHRFYNGPTENSLVGSALLKCDPDAPLVMYLTKMYPSVDGLKFDALARIYSGTIRKNDQVRVLGEGYSPEDEEDMLIQNVDGLFIYCSRYRFEVPYATAGNIILISGIDESIVKTGTIVARNFPIDEEAYTFKPLNLPSRSFIKIALEPFNPSELPKMLEGIRKASKSYPALVSKVEESGEHVLFGPGELYLDCVMHDLRMMFSEIEIRISDPVVKFCETVVETSSLKCFADSPNKKNKLTMISEPLDKAIADDIEGEKISLSFPAKQVETFFQKNHGWDLLASRGIWAFGPDKNGPNILLDDTLPDEVDKKMLYSVKDSIVQGFQWGTREGPLCDEPIRNVKFKIMDAVLASDFISRGGGQIIPTSRRVVYSSFLLATPRLMEPVYHVEIQTPADCISAVYTVLSRRRGHVIQDLPKAGSPLYTVKALIPILDSFGFETDLRTHTQGQAFCQLLFDHWQMVPGDPLDKNMVLHPLEPCPPQYLARDCMLKTRRRKGLSEDVSISKFLDDDMLIELAKQDVVMGTNLL